MGHMERTRLMRKVEKESGIDLESYLRDRYNDWESSLTISRNLNVHQATIRRWLKRFGLELKGGQVDYVNRRIKRPVNGVLNYQYKKLRIPVREIARQRGVNRKTVYRWMDIEGIERRHGSDAYLNNGNQKPNKNKLEELIAKLGVKGTASIFRVSEETITRWKQKVGLHKPRKSRYDCPEIRKWHIDKLSYSVGKNPNELTLSDFKSTKKDDGCSYIGLLEWYSAHHRHNFSGAKKHFIREFYE